MSPLFSVFCMFYTAVRMVLYRTPADYIFFVLFLVVMLLTLALEDLPRSRVLRGIAVTLCAAGCGFFLMLHLRNVLTDMTLLCFSGIWALQGLNLLIPERKPCIAGKKGV